MPPLSSAPSSTPPLIISAAMYLKPTPVSVSSSPYASHILSIMDVVFSALTTRPLPCRLTTRWCSNRQMIRSEADARLGQFKPVRLAHLVHHGCRVQCLDDPSPALSIDDEMVQQQANDLVGGEIIAVAIHATYAVCVAIRHEANVMRVLLKKCRAAPVVLDRKST